MYIQNRCNNINPWKEKRIISLNEPAKKWDVGLPVGNGRIGAMVMGDFPIERIQLNEETIWAKDVASVIEQAEGSKESLDTVVDLCYKGLFNEATRYFQNNVTMSNIGSVGSYQTLGDLWITHVPSSDLKLEGYYRQLDLETGLSTVTKPLSNGSQIIQKVISSSVDDCVVIHLESSSLEICSNEIMEGTSKKNQ